MTVKRSIPDAGLGEFIRRQRQLGHLSLRQLADACGVSNAYLSQIERGLRTPSSFVLKALADGLELSSETLYTQAGILDPSEDDAADVVEAIRHDPYLSARQREMLVEMYESFRSHREGRYAPTHEKWKAVRAQARRMKESTMINWTTQTEELLQNWTETQKKIWGGWVDATEQQVAQTQQADIWRKTVDTWEAAVKNGLETQRELTKSLSDSGSAVPNVPKDLLDWAEQTEALGTRWNAAQTELWESYFSMVRKAVPVKMLGTFDEENQKLFATWQESVEKISAAQSTWAQMWTEHAAGPATTSPKKATGRQSAKSATA